MESRGTLGLWISKSDPYREKLGPLQFTLSANCAGIFTVPWAMTDSTGLQFCVRNQSGRLYKRLPVTERGSWSPVGTRE